MHIFPSAANACAFNPGDNILDKALDGAEKKKKKHITCFVTNYQNYYKVNLWSIYIYITN